MLGEDAVCGDRPVLGCVRPSDTGDPAPHPATRPRLTHIRLDHVSDFYIGSFYASVFMMYKPIEFVYIYV